jgi:DinB family protein
MTGRPQPPEAAPYYFTYINQVIGDDVVGTIESQLEESVAFFSGISEEKSLHRYAPEKWSIRHVLSHLNDAERVFAFRAFWFARGFESAMPSFDQNVAISNAEADKIAWAAHIDEFRRVRVATVSFFRNLPQAAWARSGIASDNRFTVRALAYIIAGHLTHHSNIVRDRYL